MEALLVLMDGNGVGFFPGKSIFFDVVPSRAEVKG